MLENERFNNIILTQPVGYSDSVHLTKNAKKVVTGHDVSFKVSSLLEVGATGNTQLDRDEVIALALQTGTEAVIPLRYECEGGDTYGGNAIITGYSESSSANPDEDATISLDLEISGAFAKITG